MVPTLLRKSDKESKMPNVLLYCLSFLQDNFTSFIGEKIG